MSSGKGSVYPILPQIIAFLYLQMLTSPKEENGLEFNTTADVILVPACERLHAEEIISKEFRWRK